MIHILYDFLKLYGFLRLVGVRYFGQDISPFYSRYAVKYFPTRIFDCIRTLYSDSYMRRRTLTEEVVYLLILFKVKPTVVSERQMLAIR